MSNSKHTNHWSPLLMYVGLLGLGLCWMPGIAGVVFLSQGYIGWGWGLFLLIPAPLIMLGGGVLAWAAGNACERPLHTQTKSPSD